LTEESAHGGEAMRRILRNFGVLVRARGIVALLAFGATALTARALGPAEFGIVVLAHAYVLVVRGLLNFQPFEAMVRYGVPLHDAGDHPTLSRLTRLCLWVDSRSSLLGTLLAFLAAPVFGLSLDLDRMQTGILMAYSLTLLATGNGTARGILRLYDRFDALGTQMMLGPVIRIVGVLGLWALHGTLVGYVAVWGLAYLAENLYLNWRGFREYRRHIGALPRHRGMRTPEFGEFAGLRQFLWVTYWQSNVDLVPKHVSTLMVGYLLGLTGAGLFRLAREISGLLARPAALIRQVVFLDLTRSWNERHGDFGPIALRTAALCGAAGLVLVAIAFFGGGELLGSFAGPAYTAAAPVLTLMLLAGTFDLAASPLRAATYAIGRAGAVLRLHGAAAAVFVVLFYVLTGTLGLEGAGIATCAASALPLLGMVLMVRNRQRRVEP
jgi:O-antigen/teichoic acid export membrane protein